MEDMSRSYLVKYAEDLHALVVHGLRPVTRQIDEASNREHPEALQLIQRIMEMLTEQERRMSERLEALGAATRPTTAIQDAAAAVAGLVAGVYNQVRSEAVSKSVRDDYTFLQLCSISWLMFGTASRSLGAQACEEMAATSYRECAQLAQEIDRLMPLLVSQEMKQDGLPVQDASAWAQKMIEQAWDTSNGSVAEDPTAHAYRR